MDARQASLNRLRQQHGLMKESKISLDDPVKKTDPDEDLMTAGSTGFSKRALGTSKGMGETEAMLLKQHKELLARPNTEFIGG